MLWNQNPEIAEKSDEDSSEHDSEKFEDALFVKAGSSKRERMLIN